MKTFVPRPGPPATTGEIFRALRVVDNAPMLPAEAIPRLFNIRPEHVPARLREAGISPREARYLTCTQVESLSAALKLYPDPPEKLDHDRHLRRSRPISIRGICRAFDAFSFQHGIAEPDHPPEDRITAWRAAEAIFQPQEINHATNNSTKRVFCETRELEPA